MMKRNKHLHKNAVRAAALAIALAAVVGAAWFFGDRDEEDKESQRAVVWGTDNTIYLNGDYYGFDHRIESYLFIGTDASGEEEAWKKAGEEDDLQDSTGLSQDGSAEASPAEVEEAHGPMADFLLLLVLDYTDDTWGCLQIDRNTVTEVHRLARDGSIIGYYDTQICTAHWYGLTPRMSAENTEEAVRFLLGELGDITGYYVLNMKDIAKVNAAIGGVEITFDEDLTEVDPAFEKGATVTLTDEQAQRLVRARMSLQDDGNEARMARQRIFIDAALEKTRAASKEDPKYAGNVWSALRSCAVTDMLGNEFSRIAQMMLTGEEKGVLTLKGTSRLGLANGDDIPREEFYPDDESILDAMTRLYSLVPLQPEDFAPAN